MTFPGLLLSAAGVAVVMVALVLSSESLRAGTAEQQTRATLRTVRAALLAYHARQDQMPPPPASNAIGELLADPLAGPIVRTLQLTKDKQGDLCVPDGYGRPLLYITRPDASGTDRADFASVGFDGVLGDPSLQHAKSQHFAVDDVYGTDVEVVDKDQE